MKKKFLNIVAGALATTMIFGTMTQTFAKVGNENVEVTYNDIKIYIDGNQIDMSAEPFVINGTTYVPLRTVSENLGVDVEWEGSTKSIYITKKDAVENNVNDTVDDSQTLIPYKMEEMMPSSGNWMSDSTLKAEKIYGSIEDNATDRYFFGIVQAEPSTNVIDENPNHDRQSAPVVYNLDGEYSQFTANLASNNNSGENGFTMYIYGDDELLFTSKALTGGAMQNVDIDVSGVEELKFISTYKAWGGPGQVVVFDPTLWK